jgi:hypothetical protein
VIVLFSLFLLLCAQTKGPDTYFSDEELVLEQPLLGLARISIVAAEIWIAIT